MIDRDTSPYAALVLLAAVTIVQALLGDGAFSLGGRFFARIGPTPHAAEGRWPKPNPG